MSTATDARTTAFHRFSINISLAIVAAAAAILLFTATPALAGQGTVWTWGANWDGQLGDNTMTQRWAPVQVQGAGGTGVLGGITAVAGGDYHTVALKSDGTVWAWGYNGYSQLGDNTSNSRSTPVQVKGPGGAGVLSGVAAIACGYTHTMALKSDGTVWAWGNNDYGQLGDNTNTQRSAPVQVKGPGGTEVLSGVAAIACGTYHTVALKSDGTVWSWGYNGNYQLGDNTNTQRSAPVQVKGPGGTGTLSGITAVAGGDYHTVALKSDGTVWAWGSNDYRQLGDNTGTSRSTPVQVKGPGGTGTLSGITAVAGGYHHTTALKNDGTVLAWGNNDYGQLGDNTNTPRSAPVQVQGPGGAGVLSGITAVAAGEYRTVALKSDGSVWAWGRNDYGELGDNTQADRWTPVQVAGPGGVGVMNSVMAIAAGAYHTVAVSDLYVLAVVNGSGGGGFAPGTVATITADVPPGAIFTGWIGDVATVADVSSPVTTITVNGDLTVVATLRQSNLTLSANSPRATVFTSDPDKTVYDFNELVTVTAIPAPGWVFQGWSGCSGDVSGWSPVSGAAIGAAGPVSITFRITQDTHLEALFRVNPNPYTVTVLADPPGSGQATQSPDQSQYLYNDLVTLTSEANPGWAFRGWTSSGAGPLIYVSGSGSEDGTVRLVGWPASGYLGGWMQSGSGGAAFRYSWEASGDYRGRSTISFYVIGDAVVTPCYQPIRTRLTIFDSPGGALSGDLEGEYGGNQTVYLHAVAQSGYRFARWVVNGIDSGTEPDLTLAMTEDKEVEAVFAYQLTLTVNNGTGSGTYDEWSFVTISASVPPGYHFTGWAGDINFLEDPGQPETTVAVVDYNIVVTATFTADQTISVSATSDHGWVYQTTPQTTADRHLCLLTVAVSGSAGYTIGVTKVGGSGEVVIQPGSDQLHWRILGSSRQSGGLLGTGQVTLEVRATDLPSGASDVTTVTLTVRPLGDIDGLGGVNGQDKLLLNKRLNGLVPNGREYDLDGLGGANGQDKLILNKILNGIAIP